MINEFSDKYLNEEFKALNLKLLDELANRDDFSLNHGKVENWACGIIFVIGQLNFLFDESFPPFINNDWLCYYFDVKKENMWIKSRDIRRALKLKINDEKYSTEFVLSLDIPDSNSDLKRIRTFNEIKSKFRQRRPNDVDSVKNIKLRNLINGIPQNNEEDNFNEILMLLRSAYLICDDSFVLKKDDDKFIMPLFTSMDRHELFFKDLDKVDPSMYAFYNILYLMDNENFEGAVINPESENFTISKEMIHKIYPHNHEVIDYARIYFI